MPALDRHFSQLHHSRLNTEHSFSTSSEIIITYNYPHLQLRGQLLYLAPAIYSVCSCPCTLWLRSSLATKDSRSSPTVVPDWQQAKRQDWTLLHSRGTTGGIKAGWITTYLIRLMTRFQYLLLFQLRHIPNYELQNVKPNFRWFQSPTLHPCLNPSYQG